MSPNRFTEKSWVSTLSLISLRILIVTLLALLGLSLVRYFRLSFAIRNMRLSQLLFLYILFEIFSAIGGYGTQRWRRFLYLSGIVMIGLWLYYFEVVGAVNLVGATLIIIFIDILPLQNVSDHLFANISLSAKKGKNSFETNDNPDNETLRFPLREVDERNGPLNFPGDGQCPDCGANLDRQLVGRYCPNCGYLLETNHPDST